MAGYLVAEVANKFAFLTHHIYIVAVKRGCVFCGTALSQRSCAVSTSQSELLVNAGKCAAVDRNTWHVGRRTCETPRALMVKDKQRDSTSFLHVFSARNSVWRLARGCEAARQKGQERRQDECRNLPNLLERYALTPGERARELQRWNQRALDRLSCVVHSETSLEVLVPLAWFTRQGGLLVLRTARGAVAAVTACFWETCPIGARGTFVRVWIWGPSRPAVAAAPAAPEPVAGCTLAFTTSSYGSLPTLQSATL